MVVSCNVDVGSEAEILMGLCGAKTGTIASEVT